MMTKITENYLTTATLLRQEIAQLRNQQKKRPEMAENYEQKISLLFEEYNHLLDTSYILLEQTLQEEII